MNDLSQIQIYILESLVNMQKLNSRFPLIGDIEFKGDARDLLINIKRLCRGEIKILDKIEKHFEEILGILPEARYFNLLNGNFALYYGVNNRENTTINFYKKIKIQNPIEPFFLFPTKKENSLNRLLEERKLYQYDSHWKNAQKFQN